MKILEILNTRNNAVTQFEKKITMFLLEEIRKKRDWNIHLFANKRKTVFK